MPKTPTRRHKMPQIATKRNKTKQNKTPFFCGAELFLRALEVRKLTCPHFLWVENNHGQN
jgi:hypothetical protein